MHQSSFTIKVKNAMQMHC